MVRVGHQGHGPRRAKGKQEALDWLERFAGFQENVWYTVVDCTYDEVTLLRLLLHIFSVIRAPQLIWLPTTVQGRHILPNYETTRHKNSNPVFRFDGFLSGGFYQHWQWRYFLSSIITRPVFPWHRVDTEREWGMKNWNIIVWYYITDQITSSLCPDHLRTMCGLHLVCLRRKPQMGLLGYKSTLPPPTFSSPSKKMKQINHLPQSSKLWPKINYQRGKQQAPCSNKISLSWGLKFAGGTKDAFTYGRGCWWVIVSRRRV